MCGVSVPVIPFVHRLLFYERLVRLSVFFKYEPLFKTCCKRVGLNLHVVGGVPQVIGKVLIRLDDNVTMSGVTTFVGSKMAGCPGIEIGTGSRIGYQTTTVTGHGIHIGKHVWIANRVFIVGADGHPLDVQVRMENLLPSKNVLKMRSGFRMVPAYANSSQS